MKHMKKFLFTIALVSLGGLAVGCSTSNTPNAEQTETSQPTDQGNTETADQVTDETKEEAVSEVQKLSKNPIVTMTIKDEGVVTLELYPDKAPNTVNNFVTLAKEGFYDGLTFHRVIEGFMLQGGDPEGIGTGGPGYSIAGEFANNDYKENDLVHTKGVISMARSMMPDSAGSQFFIMSADSPHLDGEYAAFGEVIEGIEIIEKLEKVQTDGGDMPVESIVIESITVDTQGEEVPEVVKMN